jgi:hypothetical protein
MSLRSSVVDIAPNSPPAAVARTGQFPAGDSYNFCIFTP